MSLEKPIPQLAPQRILRLLMVCAIPVFAIVGIASAGAAQDGPQESGNGGELAQIQPILERYCYECHAGEVQEAEIDLAGLDSMADVQEQPQLWLRVREMLDSGQMPPPESPQPSEAESQRLRGWVRDVLADAARADAGDPGPVVLRRLNNDEYSYSIRDLTDVEALDPTREFPIDGAAGEGFTNTGSGQGMSPALVQKYLGAAKEIATHAMLVPDGIRFSASQTRRDQTNELLAQIQGFYRRFTEEGGGSAVDLQGIQFDTNQGGLLPLRQYLLATINHRDAIRSGDKTIHAVASESGLSAKYLGILWEALDANPAATASGQSGSYLMQQLRRRWQSASAEEVPALTASIAAAQQAFWKFNTIGHIGLEGGPASWMEPVAPILSEQEVRLRLPEPPAGEDCVVYFAASDLGDGNGDDWVLWKRPRLELTTPGTGERHAPLLLRDVRGLVPRIRHTIDSEIARTEEYLRAVADLRAAAGSTDELAEQRGLSAPLLDRWIRFTGLGQPSPPRITGHMVDQITNVQGHAEVNGWASGDNPSLLANRSDQAIRFQTLTVPARGVTVHPSPEIDAILGWRSPLEGQVRLKGRLADTDDVCGNGAAWRIERYRSSGTEVLASGIIENGGEQDLALHGPLEVTSGDVVVIVISARDADHSCDTTSVELQLSEIGGEMRVWNLASDIVDSVHAGNPHSDAYGNAETWHFAASPSKPPTVEPVFPPESVLARWRSAVASSLSAAEVDRLAVAVQQAVVATEVDALAPPDRELRSQVRDWLGPLDWVRISRETSASGDAESSFGIDQEKFGSHPTGAPVEATDLCLRAPHVLEIRLPRELAAGAELVTSGTLHQDAGDEASVQLRVLVGDAPVEDVSLAAPALANAGPARGRVEAAMREFGALFPPALCYSRIVPVDEVVTLTLFHREDGHLQRLMLDERQAAELDRLWDELLYVSQEPLAMTVALEQIIEFTTQDQSSQVVDAFTALRAPFRERAEAFQQRLIATEPVQVSAVVDLADRTWRRPLSEDEQQQLRSFYAGLCASEIPHEEAIRLLLARVFASPAFLFKLEQPAPGPEPGPVSDDELATRLSYFLWSSVPDDQLRTAASEGLLTRRDEPDVQAGDDLLVQQTRRMLRDPRTRRLAIHFACQWLHLRDFDKNDDKNEMLYPEFATLRGDMYEETVRFFEDMFRGDGSVLGILDADYTFLNQNLAGHYGMPGVEGPAWRRVEGAREHGRGGVLGMAAFLASQSGASRTSPILRGNWVYETLLGERLPRPPADVPLLPDAVPEGLTARQLFERHAADPACAKCHVRIDPYGFALEQYDAIGRQRPQPVDTKTSLMDGQHIDGIEGLRAYLIKDRRDDVVQQFCRKLLGYALGREVRLSDEILVDQMQQNLEQNDYRFSVAVETIVRSQQFRQIRGGVESRE